MRGRDHGRHQYAYRYQPEKDERDQATRRACPTLNAALHPGTEGQAGGKAGASPAPHRQRIVVPHDA